MTAPTLSKIHLRGSIFLECAVVNDAIAPLLKPAAANYTIHHSVSTSFNADEKLINVDLTTTCVGLDEQAATLPVNGRFRLYFTFEVDNLEELLEMRDGETQAIPNEQLSLTLISVAYSTARGMILSKTVDTVLHGFALPLLDVRSFVKTGD